MKITVYEPDDLYEGQMETKIETAEGSKSACFGSGEPEDMNLARDLSDSFSIYRMLIMAYNAGKNGETIETVFEKEDEDDE